MIGNRARTSAAVTAAALAAAAGVILAACGTAPGAGSPAAGGSAAATAAPGSGAPAASQSAADWGYYQSVMRGYGGGGGMMGGGPAGGWTSRAGYEWMTGAGGGIPGWMAGGRMPGGMMGGNTDPGQVMGRLWAGEPGTRVSPADATRLGGQVPAGAVADRAANRITFTGGDVRFTIVASPPGGPDETFRIAGLVSPAIVVPAGARVTITLVNADPDTAHGIVITAAGAAGSVMPMMTARPAFTGSALWFLGDATGAGMPEAMVSFTATAPGTYQYLCPVPRHAAEGMAGTFTITG